MADTSTALQIPTELKPADGRFGSGPSRIRPEQLEHLAASGGSLMGTSHRQKPVRAARRPGPKRVARAVRAARRLRGGARQRRHHGVLGRRDLLPDRERALHLTYGEFSSKFAACTRAAPFLADPIVDRRAGRRRARAGLQTRAADVIAWAHNETSTGVMVPVHRPDGAGDSLVLIDGTSAAAGLPVDVTECDVYYFAPQKGLSSEGGLWLALMRPEALTRVGEIADDAQEGRWIPEFLSLTIALENSRQGPDLQHPGDRDAVPARRPARLDARATAVTTRCSRAPGSRRATCTAGPTGTRTPHRS